MNNTINNNNTSELIHNNTIIHLNKHTYNDIDYTKLYICHFNIRSFNHNIESPIVFIEQLNNMTLLATIDSVLIYDSVSWTLTKSLEKRLNGNYTRMLRAILNRSWKYHPNNKQLYAYISDIFTSI